jgi:vancomycin permeability regulator SanA
MNISTLSPTVRWAILGVLIILFLIIPRWLLIRRYNARIFTLENAPGKTTAIVFGAGLRHDGTPTTVLADRVTTAASLYREGKVKKILMSGSIRGDHYNEPIAMRALALDLGVPTQDILIDTGGTRSLYTCQRAYQVFGIEQALLISQRFHLPRALVLCDAIGLFAEGVTSDLHPYRSRFLWELREIPATLRAIWDTYTLKNQAIGTIAHEPEDRKD